MKRIIFVTDKPEKASVIQVTSILFDILYNHTYNTKESATATGGKVPKKRDWQAVANRFVVYRADEFEWDEVDPEMEIVALMGAENVSRFTELNYTKSMGKMLSQDDIRYMIIPSAGRYAQLLRMKDIRSIGEFEVAKSKVLALLDEADDIRPLPTMTLTQFVFTPDRLEELISYVKVTGDLCFDFETKPKYAGLKKESEVKEASLDFNRSTPTMLGISFQPGSGWVIPLYHHHSAWNVGKHDVFYLEEYEEHWYSILINGEIEIKTYSGRTVNSRDDEEVFDLLYECLIENRDFAIENNYGNLIDDYLIPRLQEIFGDGEIRKIAHNFKFDYKIGRKLGLNFEGIFYDTVSMDHYLREDREHDLENVIARHFPEFSGYKGKQDYANGSLQELGEYCAKDNDATLRLCYVLEKEMMQDSKVYACFRNYETEKCRLLAEMEYEGMRINRAELEKTLDLANTLIAEKEELIRSHPAVRRFVKHEADLLRDKSIGEVSAKLENFRAETFEKLREKVAAIPEEKKHLKANQKIIDNLQFLEKGDCFANNFPYAKMTEWANEINRLQVGEGKIKYEFNLASGPQLGKLIYTSEAGLGHKMPISLKTKKNKVTGRTDKVKKENADTSRDYLLMLPDDTGVISLIIELGVLQKLKSTFLEGILETLDLDGFVHSDFSTIRSQRLSSKRPNLQNIPSRTSVKALKEIVARIKRMFEPNIPGSKFFQVDLSQAELRWIAYLWDVSSMKRAYLEKQDLHIMASCSVNDTTMAQYAEMKATDKDAADQFRYKGKAYNFGIVYLTSAKGLRDFAKKTYNVAMTEKEAAAAIDKYLNRLHPDIPRGHALYIAKGRKYGYVRTAFGTKRHLPNINDLNSEYRAADERVSVNSPIQGSSGQGLLFSLIIFRQRMKFLQVTDSGVTNTVHDSAIGHVSIENESVFLPELREAMNNPPTLPYFGFDFSEIMMESDIEVGANWKDLEKVNL